MGASNLYSIYGDQIKKIMVDHGLDEGYGAEIKNCTTMADVLQALSDKGAEHVAVLTHTPEPIKDMFCYIKEQLAFKNSIALALFFAKDEAPVFYG